MDKKEIHPPRWAAKFLSWYCKHELLEDLQGDLNEYFQRNLKTKGATRAKLIYIIDVFKFLRLYTIRKPEFINLLINWIMLGSYIKTSGRSIMRNKLFSAINIVGLAVSMSVGLLMIAFLSDGLAYDKFHEKADRIYRIVSKNVEPELVRFTERYMGSTSHLAARSIKESIPGVEEMTILQRDFNKDAIAGEKEFSFTGFQVNESFFKIFTFPMLYGDPATALKSPFSIVLTETFANKLFGKTDVVNETIVISDKQYTVAGVMKDVPMFSHIHFDLLASLNVNDLETELADPKKAWDKVWGNQAYILLDDGTDLATFQKNLDALTTKYNTTFKNDVELKLQPLNDIMLDENISNHTAIIGSSKIWIFGGLTFVVLLSACFNYANLSIARSFKRSREVGIRKISGALKSHVISQFITEAVVISLIALLFAFGLFTLLKPYLLSLGYQSLLTLNLSPPLIGYFVAFAVLTGIIAGSLPAIFFAKANVLKVLKGPSSVRTFQGVNLKKVLIVFQYTISITLITSTLIIYKQYKHFISYDLGFTTKNILNIQMQGNKADLLRKELNELPEVEEISQSTMLVGTGNYWASHAKKPANPQDSALVWYNTIDEHYLTLHEYRLIAGKNFSPGNIESEKSKIIVNEQFLKRLDLSRQNPNLAIGEEIKIYEESCTIIGVVKDFSYGPAHAEDSKEVMFRYMGSNTPEYLNVKVITDDIVAVRAKIEKVWKKVDTNHPFEAKFYDEKIEEAFSQFSTALKIAGFLAFLAICIASIGLLGMVIFTTETRLKEISIRKVLGASETGLIYLLGKGFFLLLLVAASIALPATYLVWDKLLSVYANRLPVTASEMLTGVLAIMIIAGFLIGSQTLKIARSNPAEVLKNE